MVILITPTGLTVVFQPDGTPNQRSSPLESPNLRSIIPLDSGGSEAPKENSENLESRAAVYEVLRTLKRSRKLLQSNGGGFYGKFFFSDAPGGLGTEFGY